MAFGVDIVALVLAIGSIIISVVSKVRFCHSGCCESDCRKVDGEEVEMKTTSVV